MREKSIREELRTIKANMSQTIIEEMQRHTQDRHRRIHKEGENEATNHA